MFGERDDGVTGLMLHLSRNGHEQEQLVPEYRDPSDKDFQDARKLELAFEALRSVQNPHLYTEKRGFTRSLAYLRVNSKLPLEEIAKRGNLPIESLREEFLALQETFQWANAALGLGRLMEPRAG